jgi:regulator of RNase E activity RraA
MEPLAPEALEILRQFNSPTVSNAIEVFNVRPRNQGFMNSEVRCIFPEMGVMVGYAVTAKIRAAERAAPGKAVPPSTHWEKIVQVPAPRVVVVQDLDDPPAVGSLWGEVNSNIHRALGCVGVVTDGGVRDIDEVRALGFHFFARAEIVSHAYIHTVETGTPVEVGGLRIQPGDLIHADRHGVLTIPREIAPKIAEGVQKMEDMERPIIQYCQSKEFTLEGLKKVWSSVREY